MSACELFDTADVELYFYGELDPVDRARVEAHLRGVRAAAGSVSRICTRSAARSRRARVVDAPPAGDWSGFMRRLDSAVARDDRRRPVEPRRTGSNPRTVTDRRTAGTLRPVIALAAMLALVTIGVVMAARFRPPTAPRRRVAVDRSRRRDGRRTGDRRRRSRAAGSRAA